MEQLKLFGRDPTNADPIFTSKVGLQRLELVSRGIGCSNDEKGIYMLCRHSYLATSDSTSRAALKVLANSMLLKPATRQHFVDGGFPVLACGKLENGDREDEFLNSRVLFLATYETDMNITDLLDKHRLSDHIITNVKRHGKLKSSGKGDPMEDMALSETLKLLFNVTHHCKTHVSAFESVIPSLKVLLLKQSNPPSKPLESPESLLVNALVNLELGSNEAQSALFDEESPLELVKYLIDILDRSLTTYSDDELDPIVTPTVTLMIQLYEVSPAYVKEYISQTLLPSLEDREEILGRGERLAAKLLNNSTNPLAPTFGNTVAHLFFNMSDKNASKFVENVGYGYASGFLFKNNIPIPKSVQEAFATSDATGSQRHVNPVTGQFLDKEHFGDVKEMTEEEKEREAEKLFVLFERYVLYNVLDMFDIAAIDSVPG